LSACLFGRHKSYKNTTTTGSTTIFPLRRLLLNDDEYFPYFLGAKSASITKKLQFLKLNLGTYINTKSFKRCSKSLFFFLDKQRIKLHFLV